MIQTVEGVFRDGKVELFDVPENIQTARVFVTFLPADMAPKGEPAVTPAEIDELRGKLAAWEQDWNAPGMEIYNDYETRRHPS